MSPVFVQDADGCVVPAVVDSDGTPTEAFTAAVRKHRRPRVNLPDGPDGPGVKDGKYTYHDPGTGRFAPYGFITPSKLKALLNPDARKRKEVLGELQDKLDDNDPLLAEYVRALRQGDKNRARQIAAAIRRAVIGDRPAAGDDRNAWDAGSREVAKLIPAAAKRADARGVHASNVPRNQIGMNPRVEAEAAAKERLAEMRNGGSLSVGRKVDFDEPEDAVDVNRPTAPGKVTAADVQPGDTVDGLRNVKGAHKVDTIRPDDSGAGYFIRLDGENEERFVHRDRLLTVTSGDRTETPEPDRAAEPLTPDQRAALEWYSGQGFGEINGRLRSGDDESDAETIATIDSAMAPLPQMTVNRTFTSEDALGDPDALLGKTLTDDAYMSTAKGGRTGGLAPLAVEIDVPEGTLGRDISDLSENPHEGEVLLGRGARLEITGVERNEFGLVRLKARVVTDATEVGADPQIERFRLADWEAIQPWKVERDPANPDPSALLLNGEPAPTWLKFSSALGTEAASHTDQAILLKPAFFALPTEESKRSALYHEAGHGLSDRMLEDQSAFDLVDDLPDFGHLNGQSTPGEVAAEAFSILWSEPSYLDEHAPGIRDAIIRKASEYGYPLPAGVRGTEPEPVDLIDTVEEQGGFTLDPRLGELVTEGIAVAVPGESAIIKADRFREDGEAERFIGDYIRKMRDDGLGDDVMIGAWYDREHDEIVLDRVQVFPDDQREEAIQAGRDRNEQAVYDLTNSNEIPTGGSGGREDIDIIGSDGDRTGEAVEGSDGRRDRPVDVPPGFQPATPDEVRDAARLNGTVRARVGNQGRMRRFAVGDEIEARYRDDEFADVWATTQEGKRRKYRVRWDRLDAFTDTDASGARYGTPDQVKDAAAATDGPIAARIADGRLSRLGLNAGDAIQVEYQNPHHGIVHVPTRDGGVRKYKVRWDRLDAHGGTADQATPTTPEPRGPKKKSGPASQANRDAKKARLTALAEENGYTYEEIRDAERQVGQIKEAIRAEAKAAAYDALGQLELLPGSKLSRVAPKRQVTDARTGRKVWKRDAASEWDWYDDLDAFEDRRLRSRWMVEGGDTTGGMNPDELAGWAFNAGLTPDDSIESGIGWYLEVTARIDAAESLGRGRLAPGTDRVNLDGLAPTTTGDARISVTDLFGPQSIDDQILAVAAASRDTDANRGLDEESGYAMLGDTVHLPADEQPWTFTRDDWGAEGDRLVAAVSADDATEDDLAALGNHIPQGVLDITTDDDDWGELYDWMAAAATAAGYDNVGTRGAASPEPEPEADRPKSRFSHPEGTPPPPAWEPPPREDRPEPPPEPEDGYRMEHRPDDTGPNAASIAGGESDDAEWSMPSDVLQYPERYTGASDMLDETVRQLRAVEGDPDGEVTIYRAAPPGTGIRPGDWVTMSRAYAEQHNESNVGDEGEITAITVPARDVKFAGDDLMEWGYWPSEEAPDTPEPDATPVDVPETVQGLLDDLKASHSNVTVELNERGDGDEKYLTLDKIASLDRSKGEGSVVLDKILDYADRTGQPVFLTPEAGIKGGKTRLTNWYKGRGFVPNKGRRKDFRSRETMVRQPSPIESTGTEAPDAPAEPDVPSTPELDPVDVAGTPEWSERRADIELAATGGLNAWDVDALSDAADFYERSASTATGSDIALYEDRAAKFRARAARIPEGGYPEPYVLDEDGDWEFSDPSFDLHTERVKAAEADVFDDEAYEAAMDQFHYRTAALRQLIAEHGANDQLMERFRSLENAQVTFERTHKRMKGSAAFLRDADAGRAEVLDGIDRDRPVTAVVADALSGTSGASYVNPDGFNGWNIAPLDPKLDEWEANVDAEIAKRLAKHAEAEDGYTPWDAPHVTTAAGEAVPATAEEIPYLAMMGGLRRGDPLHEWVMQNYTPDEVKAQLRQALADKAGANWSSPDLVPSTGAVRALAIDAWAQRMSVESGHPIDPNTPLYLNHTLTPDDLVSIDAQVVPSGVLRKLMGDKILRARQVLAGVPILSLEGGRAYDTVTVDGEDIEVRSLDRNLQALAQLGGTRFSGNPPDAEATLAAIDQALGETYTDVDASSMGGTIRDRVAEILGRPDSTDLPIIPGMFEHPSVQDPSPYERDLRPDDDAALRRSRAAGQVIHEAITDAEAEMYRPWATRQTPEQVVAQAERVLRRLGEDYVPHHAAAQAEAASDLRGAVRAAMPRKREFDRQFPKDGSSDGDLARGLLSWGVIGTTMLDGTTIRTFKDGDDFNDPIKGIEIEGPDGKTKRVAIDGIDSIAQRHKDASGKRAFGEATITVAGRAIEHPDPEQWRSEILGDWTSTVTPEWLAGYAALDEIEWDPRMGEEDLPSFQWGDVASVEPFAYKTVGREPSPLLKVTFGDGREVYVEPGSRLRVAELRPGKDGDMRMWHVGELKLPRDAYKADSPANGYWEATRPFNRQTSDWSSVNDQQLFDSKLLADVGETAANNAARRLADLDLWDRVEDPDEFLDFDDDVPDATRVVLRNVVAAMPAELLRRVGKVGVAASGTKGGRAHYNRGTKSVHLTEHSDESTAVHELFHHLEKEPELNRALWAYYTWRTGGESATLLPYSGGEHGEERSRPDSWLDPYSGKTYSNRDDHRIHRADGEAFEWWTQGAEGLFGGSPDKADPDQIAMVAGALATVFGHDQVAGEAPPPAAGTVAP